jgi:hypothetical protein
MRALSQPSWRTPAPADVLAVLVATAYSVIFIQGELGHRLPFGKYTLFLPILLLPAALLRRQPLSRAQGISLTAMTILPLAAIWALLIAVSWLTAVAVPAMAVLALVAARYPATTFAGVFVCACFYGTLKLYTPIPPQKGGDALLVGLWLAAIWQTFISRRRTGRISIWPGVACVGIYVTFTALEIFTARTITVGIQSFRGSIWFLGILLLVAYSPWSEETRRRMEKSLLALILLTGAYATYRWAFGPAGLEDVLRRANINNFGNTVRPIGSFNTTKELAGWTAVAAPFAVGMALTLRTRWRAVAALGAVMAFVAMFATGVRAAPSAAAAGILAVLVLYQLSQSQRGRRGATVAIVGLGAVLAGAGGYALTAGDDPDTSNRYQAIVDPASDPNYQARLIKWRAALEDIDNSPLGHGLGSAGVAQKRFGQYQNIGSVDVDNSYLKVAYEQGFVVGVFFLIALVALLVGLGRRAVVTLEPARAGPAIAACGTLASMLVLYFVGNYIEGVPSLAGWMLVGLGLRGFTFLHRGETTDEPPLDAGTQPA